LLICFQLRRGEKREAATGPRTRRKGRWAGPAGLGRKEKEKKKREKKKKGGPAQLGKEMKKRNAFQMHLNFN
jgi:hypothetical protein